MLVTEKVAYLKGLVEGLGIDTSSKEGKVLSAIMDVLDDLALSVVDLEDGMSEVCDQIDAVDEDLGNLEEDFYGEDECGCGCEEEDDDEDYYEVVCPKCGDTIYLDEDMIAEGSIDCPNCGENLAFDLEAMEEEEHEHGCNCGHCDD